MSRAAATAKALTAEFAAACPPAAAYDEAAQQACQDALVAVDLARHFRPIILWGGERQGVALKDAELTQFGAALWVRLYLGLFMTDGASEELRWDAGHQQFRLRVAATFRNELAPGRYPYPFWHKPAKWEAYERNRALDFLIAQDGLVTVAFRQPTAEGFAEATMRPVQRPPFDGKSWLWRDEAGRLQPVVTLFEGIYRPTNPELARLDATYRDMALALRDGTCAQCHLPSNPNAMKKLVLLQTPAHAADMIDRVVKSVAAGRMPVEEWGPPRPLEGDELATFLRRAEAFQAAVHDADAWEKGHPKP